MLLAFGPNSPLGWAGRGGAVSAISRLWAAGGSCRALSLPGRGVVGWERAGAPFQGSGAAGRVSSRRTCRVLGPQRGDALRASRLRLRGATPDSAGRSRSLRQPWCRPPTFPFSVGQCLPGPPAASWYLDPAQRGGAHPGAQVAAARSRVLLPLRPKSVAAGQDWAGLYRRFSWLSAAGVLSLSLPVFGRGGAASAGLGP